MDPFGLERFAGYCKALEYIEKYGSVEAALDAAQADRNARGWEAKSPEGQQLRNAENYLGAYWVVSKGADEWHGSVGVAGSMFLAVPAYHVVNGLSGNTIRPHSPASTSAIHASWAGLRDGNVDKPQADPDCACGEK